MFGRLFVAKRRIFAGILIFSAIFGDFDQKYGFFLFFPMLARNLLLTGWGGGPLFADFSIFYPGPPWHRDQKPRKHYAYPITFISKQGRRLSVWLGRGLLPAARGLLPAARGPRPKAGHGPGRGPGGPKGPGLSSFTCRSNSVLQGNSTRTSNFLDFGAFLEQNPGQKARVLRGVQNCRKQWPPLLLGDKGDRLGIVFSWLLVPMPGGAWVKHREIRKRGATPPA